MSEVFIGIVFLAIVGGAAESGSAIAMARGNRMDLAVGIALGSCIQIALFVAPDAGARELLRGARSRSSCPSVGPRSGRSSWPSLIGALVAGDGRANWYKGVQLVTVYLIIALMFYFIPTTG